MDYAVEFPWKVNMRSVSATTFARNFAVFQHEVHREPMAVTSHSRVTGYFVSPEDFAEYEALRAKARKVLVVGQLPNERVEALERSRMDERRAALNALMQD
jgi:PHD/YefM family antitoxin component YafN of YafNO toxin-antitoxin module